jgi:hypothetical protein
VNQSQSGPDCPRCSPLSRVKLADATRCARPVTAAALRVQLKYEKRMLLLADGQQDGSVAEPKTSPFDCIPSFSSGGVSVSGQGFSQGRAERAEGKPCRVPYRLASSSAKRRIYWAVGATSTYSWLWFSFLTEPLVEQFLRFSSLGGLHLSQREISKGEPQLFSEPLLKRFENRVCMSTVRTFVVAIFDQCDRGGGRTLDVIVRTDRHFQLRHNCLISEGSPELRESRRPQG